MIWPLLACSFACGDGAGTDGSPDDATASDDAGPQSFELVIDNHGGGVVSSVGSGWQCGAECRHVFAPGTVVELVATAGSNAEFGGWHGACAGTGPCPVTLDRDQRVSASFSPPTHLWSRRHGGEFGYKMASLALDSAGNAYVFGGFGGTMSAGGPELNCRDLRGDVFIAKYSPGGEHIWSKSFGGVSADSAAAIVVDSTGNVIVAGTFYDEIEFGGEPLVAHESSDDGSFFLVKLTSAGEHVWSLTQRGNGVERVDAVAVDDDDVLVAGTFDANIHFGEQVFDAVAGSDVFFAKYTADGQLVWAQAHGSLGEQVSSAVAVDEAGNVLVAGHFKVSVGLGGEELVSRGDYDGFVAKLAPDGSHLWSFQVGGAGSDGAAAVAITSSGDAIVAGALRGAADVGCGETQPVGDCDMLVAHYSAEGSCLWSERFGGVDAKAAGAELALDSEGNIVVAGGFGGIVDIGGGGLASLDAADVLLVKVDPSGNPLWGRRYGGSATDLGMAITVFDDDIFVCGQTQSDVIDFGGDQLAKDGYLDFFLARLAQ